MFKLRSLISSVFITAACVSWADTLTLSSKDIVDGQMMNKHQEFNGFGCTGDNLSPHLKWTSAPTGTKSFAVTVFDPDAPTDSGWWHWQIINIPASVTELNAGAGNEEGRLSPSGSMQIMNDYGSNSFGGACPPVGHGEHRYRFTVHALSVESLDVTEKASAALTSYLINANTIASSTIEALYQRK